MNILIYNKESLFLKDIKTGVGGFINSNDSGQGSDWYEFLPKSERELEKDYIAKLREKGVIG